MTLISNKRLDLTRIPDPDGDFGDWHLFAHTIDGYKKAGSFKTKYWTPGVHKGAFAQPRFIQDLVDKAKPSR